jgi:hypothetical protein
LLASRHSKVDPADAIHVKSITHFLPGIHNLFKRQETVVFATMMCSLRSLDVYLRCSASSGPDSLGGTRPLLGVGHGTLTEFCFDARHD